MPNEHTGVFRLIGAALVAAIFCLHADATRAEGVNFDLLIESLKAKTQPAGTLRPARLPAAPGPTAGAPPAPKLKPVQELAEYVACLRKGACEFSGSVTGEDAAKQFGYSRLFASAYEEVVLSAKGPESSQGRPLRADIVARFEEIARQEETIDQLLRRNEQHATAIAYLRALQNGDVEFPRPQAWAPAPPVLLARLMSAYPEATFDINDSVFAAIYRQTREFASDRMKAAGEIRAPEVIAEFRRLVLASATSPESTHTPSSCELGTAVGQLTIVTQSCPGLQLSKVGLTLAAAISRYPKAADCKDKSAAALKLALEKAGSEVARQLCERAEQDVRSGKNVALENAK